MILHGIYHNGHIDIAEKEYLVLFQDKKIEVEIIIDNKILNPLNKNGSVQNARGILKKYKNLNFKEEESSAWGKAVKDKHENR